MRPQFKIVDAKNPMIVLPINKEFTLGKFYDKFCDSMFGIIYEDDIFQFRKSESGMYFDVKEFDDCIDANYILRIIEYLNALYDGLFRFCLNKCECDVAIDNAINFEFIQWNGKEHE